jgi:SYP7 family syntaxin
VVVKSQMIRNELSTLKTEFDTLTKILKDETSKKKTKFTPEELDIRKDIVADLASKLEELSQASSRSGGGGIGGGGFVPSSTFTPTIAQFTAEEDEESKFGGPSAGIGGGGSRGFVKDVEMSDVERQGLAQIEKNKLEEEKMLDLIGDNMKDLKEIALGLNEEVTKQKYILDDIDEKMEKVSDKMDSTIKNLRKTAAESNRGGDKICMDMICLILILGVLTVIYNMVKKSGAI